MLEEKRFVKRDRGKREEWERERRRKYRNMRKVEILSSINPKNKKVPLIEPPSFIDCNRLF